VLLAYYIAAINIEMEWDEEKEGKEHLDRSQFPLTPV